MSYQLASFDAATFLKERWQKQPLVIRQGLPDFADPIDENDLAGLAQEEGVDSRIVSKVEQAWQVTHGPFESYETICVGDWTLMVQGVDKYIHDVDRLSHYFSFIPHWRFDDVMVSFAVENAGVGPHVDQYDVFLIQGKGARRWLVGRPEQVEQALRPHPDLQQTNHFTPEIDVVLQPGDILYVPPGWPHWGQSIKPSMTYSIGFRAPNASELISPVSLALSESSTLKRYKDGQLSGDHGAADVSKDSLLALKYLLHEAIDNTDPSASLLCYLSEQQLPLVPCEETLSEEDIESLFEEQALNTVAGCKPLISEAVPDTLFIDGESYSLPANQIEYLLTWFRPPYTPALPKTSPKDPMRLALLQLASKLIARGIVFFD